MEGLCRNQSIERLDIRRCEIDFSSLTPFIVNNSNLRSLELWNVDISLGNAAQSEQGSAAVAIARMRRLENFKGESSRQCTNSSVVCRCSLWVVKWG
eukprot:scaffold13193_cov183-Skeletonema_marinoi.AAC.4